MQRLIHALSRRRRGRPAPVWRERRYRPTIDIRLVDMHEGITGEGSGPIDEGPAVPRAQHREIWEL
jgi:hypothetical protein